MTGVSSAFVFSWGLAAGVSLSRRRQRLPSSLSLRCDKLAVQGNSPPKNLSFFKLSVNAQYIVNF